MNKINWILTESHTVTNYEEMHFILRKLPYRVKNIPNKGDFIRFEGFSFEVIRLCFNLNSDKIYISLKLIEEIQEG